MIADDEMRASFRNAMASLGSAVCVITSAGDAGRLGFTATAVSSVTDDPPTLLVCMNRNSTQNEPLLRNGVLCVNVLAAHQQSLSGIFAGGIASMDERFASAQWVTAESGSPLLKHAVANADCTIDRVIDVGTHTVIFARVAHVQTQPGRGLVYFDRGYHHVGAEEPHLPVTAECA